MCENGTYPATLEEFKIRYDNDFDFSVITDAQIELVFEESCSEITRYASCLAQKLKTAFMALVAYHLFKLYGSGKIVDAEEGEGSVGLISSESMDDVSLSYSFPQDFLKYPSIFFYTSNKYGMQYLEAIYPCFQRGRIINTLNFLERGCR